jgi:hypothetical protein
MIILLSSIVLLMIIFIIVGGSIWIKTSAPSSTWISITSDDTGQYLAAVNNVQKGGYIYTSSSGLIITSNQSIVQ